MQHRQPKRANKAAANKKVAKAQKRAVSNKVRKVQNAKAFVSTASARRAMPNWAKAKSPFEKDLPQEFAEAQTTLDTMWREVYAAPKEVKPIDFAYFEGKIKNKTAFAEIKKQYEAVSFPVVKTAFQTKEAAEAKVKAAKGQAEFMQDTIVNYKARIEQLKFASTVIPFLSLQEEIKLVPGLDQEFDRQLSNYLQIPDENVIKALDLDTTKINEQLAAGVFPELPAEGINKIMFTPVYFAAIKQHEDYCQSVLAKHKIQLPSATALINASLKAQGQLPTMEEINQHLDEMELPFTLTAVKPTTHVPNAFAM